MFPAVIFALFTYSICEIEIQCSVIRGESSAVPKARDFTDLSKNLTLLKKIENSAIHSKSVTPSPVKIQKIDSSTGKNKPQPGDGRADPQTPSILEKRNRFPVSGRNDLLPKDDVGHRKPKFLGPLAFLTGLGAASLATAAASANANAFVKIFSPAIPVPIGAPGYFTGFYEPHQYLPFPYPVLYPVPRLVNNYENLVSGVPAFPSPLPPKILNATVGKISPKNDTNFDTDDETNESSTRENAEESREAAATQADLKRAVAPDDNDNNVESPVDDEEIELRQAAVSPQTTTTTSTTISPATMNTSLTSNITVPMTSPINVTGPLPHDGYYGGSPQHVGHVIFTTEDPQQRYLTDYHGEAFALPFERPAVFSPYQNAEYYPNTFVNSFSSGEPYPEFLNTIESDRYVYDSENHRNYNGFRPILK